MKEKIDSRWEGQGRPPPFFFLGLEQYLSRGVIALKVAVSRDGTARVVKETV